MLESGLTNVRLWGSFEENEPANVRRLVVAQNFWADPQNFWADLMSLAEAANRHPLA